MNDPTIDSEFSFFIVSDFSSMFSTFTGASCRPFVMELTYTDPAVTLLSSNAFTDCCYITSVNIPQSVVNIQSYSFYGCTSLTSIIIPAAVSKNNACSSALRT